MKKLVIHCDGGARGNPGPAAAGVVVYCQRRVIFQAGYFLGQKTNNEAEYLAVKLALAWLSRQPGQKITAVDFYLDSQLVVSQLEGTFKIKAKNLQPLAIATRQLINQLEFPVHFFYHPRQENKAADGLVNQVLDCFLKD